MSMLKSVASAIAVIAVCNTSLAGGLSFKSSPLQAGRAFAVGASIVSLTAYLKQHMPSGETKTLNIATRQGQRITNEWHQHIWRRRMDE